MLNAWGTASRDDDHHGVGVLMSVKEEPCVRQTVWQVWVAVLFLTAHVYSQTCTLCIVYTESAWKDLSLGLGKELWARLLFSSTSHRYCELDHFRFACADTFLWAVCHGHMCQCEGCLLTTGTQSSWDNSSLD